MSSAKESLRFPPTDCLMIPIQNNRPSTTTKRTCQTTSAPSTVRKPSPRRVAVLLTSPYEWGSGPSRRPTRTAGSDSVLNIPSPCALAESRSKKPECSYAVLIGIAMRAAQAANHGDRLPVIDIYRFIEEEFPYFKNCKSSGWKNCVRHCLSLGQFFRKVERCADSVAIKGNYWEVIPEKRPFLNRDIEVFVLEEHKKFVQRHKKCNAALGTKNTNSSSQSNRVLRVTLSPSHPHISHPTLSHPSIDTPSSHPSLSIPHSPSSHPPTHPSHTHPPLSHSTTTACVLAQLQQCNSCQISSTRDTSTKSEVELSPFTTPDQQNKLPVVDTVAESHLALSSHPPTLLCPRGETTTVLCDCSTSIDEEDPLPCVSTEVQYTKGHVQKKDDNNEDDSFSVTGSEVEKQRDCCSSEMYVFPGVVSPHSKSAHSKCNTQNSENVAVPSSGNESNEKEESPLINPNHPVVNNGTLASINGVVAVPDPDVAEFVTTSSSDSMSYVMAPHPTKATLCRSSSSRSFVSKMSHSIFCSPPNSIRKHNHITLYKSLLSPPRFHRRTHAGFKEERIPPHVRPLFTHMNDPSHFLPSSHFYSTPPYIGKNVRNDSICNGSGYRKVDASAPRRRGTDLKARNNDLEGGKTIGTKLTQVPPTLTCPQPRCAPKPQPQREEGSIGGMRRDNCYQQTNHNIITDDDSLTAQHRHEESINRHLDLAIESTNGEQFFEVSTDWMKLTIAREEEVESSVI